jgi:hypothetical protein
VAYNYFHEKAQVIVTDLERESLRVLRGLFQQDDVAPLQVAPHDLTRVPRSETS